MVVPIGENTTAKYRGEPCIKITVPYDGVDLRLKDPYCFCCQKQCANNWLVRPPPKKLLKCKGCDFAYYCSREDQRADWKSHKPLCTLIKRHRKHMEKTMPQDAFMTSSSVSGNFWRFPLTFYYVKAKYDLALQLHQPAFEMNASWIWKEVNYEMQECLRLCHLHNGADLGMRGKFPLFLLNVDRDDDVYSYCRYWIPRENRVYTEGFDDDGDYDYLHIGSKEGDWIYPREEGCRSRDFFEDCPDTDPNEMDNQMLLAVWLVKMKIRCYYGIIPQLWVHFTSTKLGRSLGDDLNEVILDFLTDCEAGTGLSMEAQCDRLGDQLDRNVPSLLPALLNPEPLFSQTLPRQPEVQLVGIRGTPLEAYHILYSCMKCAESIPDLRRWLEVRYGENPTYDTVL